MTAQIVSLRAWRLAHPAPHSLYTLQLKLLTFPLELLGLQLQLLTFPLRLAASCKGPTP